MSPALWYFRYIASIFLTLHKRLWLTDKKLSLHLGKTECMLFGPKRKIRQIKNFYVKCYEHVITSTEVVKYLGVHIDKYLNFENIVSNIVSKVNIYIEMQNVLIPGREKHSLQL